MHCRPGVIALAARCLHFAAQKEPLTEMQLHRCFMPADLSPSSPSSGSVFLEVLQFSVDLKSAQLEAPRVVTSHSPVFQPVLTFCELFCFMSYAAVALQSKGWCFVFMKQVLLSKHCHK